MCTRIRVLVLDDHDLIVEGIKSILQSEPDMECVSQPVHGELEVLDAIRSCQPDVLLQDAKMPDFELLPALDEIAAQFPREWGSKLSLSRKDVHNAMGQSKTTTAGSNRFCWGVTCVVQPTSGENCVI